MVDIAGLVQVARTIARGPLTVAAVRAALADLTPEERREVGTLVLYALQQQAARRGQRRACALLRSLLSPAQQAEWRRSHKTFTVTGSAGGRYRLCPTTGGAWRLARHGRYDIGVASFCLHDPERQVPPADETIGHLLWLLADEPAFCARANMTVRPHAGWDGAWLRACAAARRARRAA